MRDTPETKGDKKEKKDKEPGGIGIKAKNS